MAHDVFISYSHVDKVYADYVCNYLESEGIRCWYAPRDIKYGDEWAAAITAAIESSKGFILILTQNSNLSNQVYKEVNLAVTHRAYLFTLKLESIELQKGLNYYLSDTHWIDADKTSFEKHLPALVSYLKTILTGEGQAVNIGFEYKLDYYARVGDIGLIKKSLQLGDTPDNPLYVDPDGNTPIHFAAKEETGTMLELLLPHSNKFDEPNNEGCTPLMYARAGKSVQMLLEKGANVNAQDRSGKTALMYPTNLERSRLLLQAGANVNIKDDDGNTALHHTCWFIGNRSEIELLLQYGADINARNQRGETPLGRCTVLQFNTKKMLIEMGGKY